MFGSGTCAAPQVSWLAARTDGWHDDRRVGRVREETCIRVRFARFVTNAEIRLEPDLVRGPDFAHDTANNIDQNSDLDPFRDVKAFQFLRRRRRNTARQCH